MSVVVAVAMASVVAGGTVKVEMKVIVIVGGEWRWW
jgi:hypothetical protein